LEDFSTALHTPIQKQEALCLVKVCIGNNLFLYRFLTDRMKLEIEFNMAVYFDFTIHKQPPCFTSLWQYADFVKTLTGKIIAFDVEPSNT
jgi:hypothetical protein